MRKLLVLMAAIGLFIACQKEEPAPENVTFKLSYSLDKGISMTRGGEDLYASFYENFVKTKIVGHPKYNLKFYQGDIEVATFNGEWEATLVTLPEGTYTVKGTSKSNGSGVYTNSENQHLSDMSLSFNEEVVVSKNMTSLMLNPTYSCYLVFAKESLFSSIAVVGPHSNSTAMGGTPPDKSCEFFSAGDIKYVFINSASSLKNITYTTVDGDSGTLNLKALNFQIGNYYCLDAVATGYQIPPMNNGF